MFQTFFSSGESNKVTPFFSFIFLVYLLLYTEMECFQHHYFEFFSFFQASELAASLCAMPESLSAMVTKSKRNLAVLADSEGAVDELLQKKHDCEEKISATSATIKELVGQLSDDNENSDAKEELQRLNSEFTSLNESCNSLERSILERAGNSPLHAWRVTADKTKNPTPAEDTPADPKTTDEPTDNGEKKKKKHKSKKNKKEKSGEGGGAD